MENEEASRRIQDTLQECVTEGLLAEGMVMDWYLVGSYMGPEGDTGSIFMNSPGATTPGSLGLVTLAKIGLEEEVRAWFWEDE